MSWDLVWRTAWRRLEADRIRSAAEAVAKGFEGVTVEVEVEEKDCITCFFSVPDEGGPRLVEISFYDLGGDGRVLSLEIDASDNQAIWEDASELAEQLADAVGANLMDL